MKTWKQQSIEKVKSIVANNRLITDRKIQIANESSLNNVRVDVCPMGNGGVGQIKEMADGTTRVQISHGWGRYNYAYVAIVSNENYENY